MRGFFKSRVFLRINKMPKTDAQRRAAADARKRDAGLTRVSVWVPRDQSDKIKGIARKMVDEKRGSEYRERGCAVTPWRPCGPAYKKPDKQEGRVKPNCNAQYNATNGCPCEGCPRVKACADTGASCWKYQVWVKK